MYILTCAIPVNPLKPNRIIPLCVNENPTRKTLFNNAAKHKKYFLFT